jgi:hypothetical protein
VAKYLIMVKFLQMFIKCTFVALAHNGWRYGVGLPCRLFHLTNTVNGKLHYTACCVSGAVKLVEC